MVASVAYARAPVYEQYAPRQLLKFNDVLRILDQQHPPPPLGAGQETPGLSTPAEVGVGVQVMNGR